MIILQPSLFMPPPFISVNFLDLTYDQYEMRYIRIIRRIIDISYCIGCVKVLSAIKLLHLALQKPQF